MRFYPFFWSVVTLFCLSPAQSQLNSDSLLSAYIQESWNNHPDLHAMRAMVSAESSRVGMSSSWMNPELRVGLMNLPATFNLWSDPMTMLQVGVMQQLPFPGKLKSAGKAQQSRAAAAQAQLERGKYEMAAMIAMAFYDLAAACQIQKALHAGAELAREMTQAAQIMVGSGMGAQSDLYRAQIEQQQWELRINNNLGEIGQKRAAIAYALGRSEAQAIPDIDLPDNPPAPPSETTTFDDTPRLRSSLLEVEAARSDLRRAKLDYYPDVNVMLAYGIRGDLKVGSMGNPMGEPLKQDNMLSLEVSFPIPLFYRGNQVSKTQEMRAMLTQSELQYQKNRLFQRRELEELRLRWTAKYNNYQTLKDNLIPAAEALWTSTLNDYRAGKAPLMNLSQARMTLVMNRMDAAMLLADIWGLRGQWQAVLGLPLTDLSERK